MSHPSDPMPEGPFADHGTHPPDPATTRESAEQTGESAHQSRQEPPRQPPPSPDAPAEKAERPAPPEAPLPSAAPENVDQPPTTPPAEPSEPPAPPEQKEVPTPPTDPTAEEGGPAAGPPSKATPEAAPAAQSTPAGESAAGARSAQVDVRQGKVMRVSDKAVLLDLGNEHQGSVPIEEFAGQPLPRIGDDVSVMVISVDTATGKMIVSKRQADELSFWETLKPGDLLEGVVTGMNKGGLDIDIGGARAFLPSSQVDVRHVKDISVLIGEHVRCMVTQVDRTTRDIVVSRRKLIDKERKAKRAQALQELTEGELRTGKVSNLTEFGAFINVGGIEGLLHVTDMSWGRIQHPSEMVQVGEELEVKILKVDRRSGKVSLGLKQAQPDPWENVEEKYPAGSRVKGRVLRFADFGAFIELEQGIEALLPISEMSWSKRINHPSEVINLGDELELVVLKADARKHRISLGLKQIEGDPWDKVEEEFPTGSKLTGKVTKIMDFGAFVELKPGLEGLIHISELSDRRVNQVSDVVKEGQDAEVRVLKVDKEAQRISLSMKPPPREREAPAASEKSKKKRKRPLRGGLSSHFEW